MRSLNVSIFPSVVVLNRSEGMEKENKLPSKIEPQKAVLTIAGQGIKVFSPENFQILILSRLGWGRTVFFFFFFRNIPALW